MIKAEANVIGTIDKAQRKYSYRQEQQSVFVICHDSRFNGC